jgi:hypothetical protein
VVPEDSVLWVLENVVKYLIFYVASLTFLFYVFIDGNVSEHVAFGWFGDRMGVRQPRSGLRVQHAPRWAEMCPAHSRQAGARGCLRVGPAVFCPVFLWAEW